MPKAQSAANFKLVFDLHCRLSAPSQQLQKDDHNLPASQPAVASWVGANPVLLVQKGLP